MQLSHLRMLPLPALALVGALLACATSTSPVTGALPQAPQLTVHEVEQTTTLSILPGANPGPATASCPTGELALGGGWSLPAVGGKVYAAMLTGNTWNVFVRPPGPTSNPGAAIPGAGARAVSAAVPSVGGIAITAYIECLAGAGAGASVIPRDASLVVPAFNYVHGDVLVPQNGACDLYERKVGTGFDFSSAPSFLELQGNIDDAFANLPYINFRFNVANYDSAPHPATLTMYCLTGVSGSTVDYPPVTTGPQPHPIPTPIPAGMTRSFTTSCAADPNVPGAVAIGGGWDYTYASTTVGIARDTSTVYSSHAVLQGSTPVGWQVAVSTADGGMQDITSEAICLQVPAAGQSKAE
jgi:hypothetical protein